MYRHHIPSTTSLSDDEDLNPSPFFADKDSNHAPILFPVPAQWSSKLPTALPTKSTLMAHLPPELLIHILRHLHSPRDLYSCLRVSRTWCECAIELLWHKPAFPKYGTVQKMSHLLTKADLTFAYAHFIRRLNFLSLASDLRDDIFTYFSRCDRLERLTLVGCKHISGRSLADVLPCFSSLVAIDLTGVVETSDAAIAGLAQAATRLQGINLAGCSKVSDIGVMSLATHCALLRRVKLSGLELITDKPISALAQRCPLLLEIDLNYCSLITDISIRHIWMYSVHMREMRLSHCPELTDAAFPAPHRPEHQPSVTNPFAHTSNDHGEILPPLILRRTFENLRMLDLTACSLITDDAIEGIISHAPKIRNLVLSKCSLLTDRSVEKISTLGRHLHYLHLGHAHKITDRSVRTLARSCTRIRYIDFANCTLLTDMSVFELSALPKLRRIGLVRVNNLTDEAIYALGERHATLERIHLSYCEQISAMAMHFLLLRLPKLTHLSLTGVPAFRQPDIQRFCREAPREFNSAQRMSFCVFSGKGVLQLRTFLSELFERVADVTDDTEEEYDYYNETEEGTPEPDADVAMEEEEEQLSPILNNITFARGGRQPQGQQPSQPQAHEFVFQRDRSSRAAIIPASNSSSSARNPPPAVNLQGATSRLIAQIEAATPVASSSRRSRAVPQNSRTVADMLPIVESSNSPPPSDVASNRSGGTSGSNNAAFFRLFNREGGQTSAAARSDDGALTPDLNYAEIGHGRGTGGHHPMQRDRDVRPHARPHVADREEPTTPPLPAPQATTSRPWLQSGIGPVLDSLHHRGNRVTWPYREQTSAGPSSAGGPSSSRSELQESVHLALGGGEGRGRRDAGEEQQVTPADGRGRSVRRGFRNASSYLFGRSSAEVHEEGNGSSGNADSAARRH